MKSKCYKGLSKTGLATEVLERVAYCVHDEFERRGGSVEIVDGGSMPRFWGGCVIPLHLPELTECGLQSCYLEMKNKCSDAVIQEIGYRLYRDCKRKKKVKLGAALVNRNRVTKTQGLLIYWER